ncbi:MAG: T9SS type A sorting domain-containing protein [Bacteroidota bacterium]|nr:T9SS type A sorting domain-containing protein [Bacteroidota bacterium]
MKNLILIIYVVVCVSGAALAQPPNWESLLNLGNLSITSVASDGYGQHLVGPLTGGPVKHYLYGNDGVLIYNTLSITGGEYPVVTSYSGKVRVTMKIGNDVKIYQSTDGGSTWPTILTFTPNPVVPIYNIDAYSDVNGTHIVWENNSNCYHPEQEIYYVRYDDAAGAFRAFKNVTDLSSPSTGMEPKVTATENQAHVVFRTSATNGLTSRDLNIPTATWDAFYVFLSGSLPNYGWRSTATIGDIVYTVGFVDVFVPYLIFTRRHIDATSWQEAEVIGNSGLLCPDNGPINGLTSRNGALYLSYYSYNNGGVIYSSYTPTGGWGAFEVVEAYTGEQVVSSVKTSASQMGIYVFFAGTSPSNHQHMRRKPFTITAAFNERTFLTGNNWLSGASLGIPSNITVDARSGSYTNIMANSVFNSQGTFNINSGSTLNHGSGAILTLNGGFNISGTVSIGGTGSTVVFNQNTAIPSGAILNIIDGTTMRTGSGISLTLNGSTVNLGSNASLTLNGGFTITGTSTLGGTGGTVTFNQNTTIPTGTTLIVTNKTLIPSSGVTLTLNGGFTIGGTVSMGGTNGTVTFNQGLTTSAGTAFNIRAGTTVNIGYLKSLTLNGSFSATSATLASTNRYYGSWERINLYGGPNTISYCLVKYGNNGIWINNSSTNTITGCTFDSCMNAGVYSVSSNRNKGALTINGSTFLRTISRGIGILNGRADINNITSRFSAQGIMIYNALVYLDDSKINSNTSRGSYISGSTATLYFSADDFLGGCNNFNNNGSGEVYIISSGCAYLGYYDIVKQTLYAGENNIINDGGVTGRLVYNAGRCVVYAHKNYWGTNITNGFYGQVDWSYPLSTDPCPTGLMKLAKSEEPSTDIDFEEYVSDLKSIIEKNSTDATTALRQLAALAGPGGSYEKALGSRWEDFLNDIRKSKASSADLKSLADAYYVHSFLNREEYQKVLDVTKEVLSTNPDDDLWLLCQSDRISALVNLGRTKEAQVLIESIKDRVEKMDPDLIGILYSIVGDEPRAKIASKNFEEMPDSYTLEQNYPNPFNPLTDIFYGLPEDAYVVLKVYDVLGREVITLVDEYQDAGYKSIVLNAAELPSGVYFYRLQAGSFTDVKKMLLAK